MYCCILKIRTNNRRIVVIIEEIGQTVEQTSSEGDLMSVQVDVRLREYTGKIPEDKQEQKGVKKR